MYAYLKGKLTELTIGKCIIDVGGVGYLCKISLNTYTALKDYPLGSEIKLYQYLHVKEDELSLFGFYTEEEKNLFMKFILVEGIGPKKALEIFNFGKPEEFIEAIENQDANFFVKVKGIGQKQAQKVILELTGKLGKLSTRNISIINELVEGLQTLGFSKLEIEKAINNFRKQSSKKIEEMEFEDAFKSILSLLSKFQ
ncbi:MAG: Holliday junction branch migration protein RuvA [Spirochaetales bacterium]|jgi:Holliday junction DNA helicase RuvA|nr:Holliday junction branch migration protein RuvA [Exilispira sp.]NMC67878.1 Holliday junction branch migration protein RuvA [Spirochaetales bacterium]